MAYQFSHDEALNEEEVSVLGDCFQDAQDWGDLSGELQPADRVRTQFEMNGIIESLHNCGFILFGGREIQQLVGGIGPPMAFAVAILRAVRPTNPDIFDTTAAKAP